MLLRIGSGDFVSKEIFYHGICRVNYQNKAEKTSQAMKENNNQCLEKPIPETPWHVARDVHVKAFEALCCFVDEVVLENTEVFLVSELNNHC